MFDNTNHYELRTEIREERTIYIAVFKDGNGQNVESEISKKVAKTLFGTFVKTERNLKRSDERHLNYTELTEDELQQRVFILPKSLEEEIDTKIRNEQLYKAIEQLPEIQKRRLILYYFEKLTLEQISSIEGCSSVAVKYSLDCASKNIKKYFSK